MLDAVNQVRLAAGVNGDRSCPQDSLLVDSAAGQIFGVQLDVLVNLPHFIHVRIGFAVGLNDAVHAEIVVVGLVAEIAERRLPLEGYRATTRLEPGQKVQAIEYDNRVELIPVRPIAEMRGLLKGIDTTVEREGDRV